MKFAVSLFLLLLVSIPSYALDKELFNIVAPKQTQVDPFSSTNAVVQNSPMPAVKEERTREVPKLTVRQAGVEDYSTAYYKAMAQHKDLIVYNGTNIAVADQWQNYANQTGQLFCMIEGRDYPEFVSGITELRYSARGMEMIKKNGVMTYNPNPVQQFYGNEGGYNSPQQFYGSPGSYSMPQQQFYSQPQFYRGGGRGIFFGSGGAGGGSCGPSG